MVKQKIRSVGKKNAPISRGELGGQKPTEEGVGQGEYS